jgi:signal transduction histidine kinase
MASQNGSSNEQHRLGPLHHLCEQLRTQNRLDDAERLEEVIRKLEEHKTSHDKQLGVIRHALDGHVTAINGAIEFLKEYMPAEILPVEPIDPIDVLTRRSQSLMQIAKDLLALTTGRSADTSRRVPEKERFDLVRMVDQTCLLYEKYAKKLDVKVSMASCAHSELYVTVDQDRMNHVVDQLIDNALRYVAYDGSGLVVLSLDADETTVYLNIRDNGRGIPEEDQERVFETGYHDPEHGRTGIGLAMVRKFVHEHGGDIDLESAPGRGTTFFISLPRSEPPANMERLPLTLISGHTGREYLPQRRFQLGQASAYEATGPDYSSYWIKVAHEHDAAHFAEHDYEARLFANINNTNEPLTHRYLIQMHDRGRRRDPETNEWLRFTVFLPAPGEPLHVILEARALADTYIELTRSIAIARHMAEVLVYLHEQGVMLRTLSPAAVYTDMNTSQTTTLIDLSAARYERDLEQGNHTPPSSIYSSPEQINGTLPGRRSDIYVFGVFLFEVLTGEQPFSDEIGHMSTPPPDPRQWREDIPDELADIVLRCLQKWPMDRYAHAGDLLEALHAVPTPPTTEPDTDEAAEGAED